MVALRAPELYFWPAKTRKKLELFQMHTCLWPCAQIWFRYKWRNLVTASLLLHCNDGYSYRRYWNEFFQLCFMFQIEVFSYCTLTETFAIRFQKWFDHQWIDFGVFFGKWLLSLTSYLYGLKFARDAQLLFYFDEINFFRCLGWGVFWSVLWKCFYFLARGFCNMNW